jgi:hypothetical protein
MGVVADQLVHMAGLITPVDLTTCVSDSYHNKEEEEMTDQEISSWISEWQYMELNEAKSKVYKIQTSYRHELQSTERQTGQDMENLTSHLKQTMDTVTTIRSSLNDLIELYLAETHLEMLSYFNTVFEYGQSLIVCMSLDPDSVLIRDTHHIQYWQLWAMEGYVLHAIHNKLISAEYSSEQLLQQQHRCVRRFCATTMALLHHPSRNEHKIKNMAPYFSDLATIMRRISLATA